MTIHVLWFYKQDCKYLLDEKDPFVDNAFFYSVLAK